MAMGSVRSSNSSCIIPQTWSSWWLRYDNALLISWGGDYQESGDGNDDFCYYDAYITSVCRELAPKEEVNEVDLESIFDGKVWETFPKLNKQSSWFGEKILYLTNHIDQVEELTEEELGSIPVVLRPVPVFLRSGGRDVKIMMSTVMCKILSGINMIRVFDMIKGNGSKNLKKVLKCFNSVLLHFWVDDWNTETWKRSSNQN